MGYKWPQAIAPTAQLTEPAAPSCCMAPPKVWTFLAEGRQVNSVAYSFYFKSPKRINMPTAAASKTWFIYLAYPCHGPRLNRRVPICSQYDGGLAHSRPVTRRVVLLRGSPERVAVLGGPPDWIPPECWVNGYRSRDCRRGAFKRPICFIGVRFCRFILRGTKSFGLVARRLGRRVMMGDGLRAPGSVVRFVCCKSRGSFWLLRRHVAAGHVSLLREILEHGNDRSTTQKEQKTWIWEAAAAHLHPGTKTLCSFFFCTFPPAASVLRGCTTVLDRCLPGVLVYECGVFVCVEGRGGCLVSPFSARFFNFTPHFSPCHSATHIHCFLWAIDKLLRVSE